MLPVTDDLALQTGGAFGIFEFMAKTADAKAGPVVDPSMMRDTSNDYQIMLTILCTLDRVKPGQVMKDMKEQKCTDLEVTFVGMAFVISGALEIIEDTIKTL